MHEVAHDGAFAGVAEIRLMAEKITGNSEMGRNSRIVSRRGEQPREARRAVRGRFLRLARPEAEIHANFSSSLPASDFPKPQNRADGSERCYPGISPQRRRGRGDEKDERADREHHWGGSCDLCVLRASAVKHHGDRSARLQSVRADGLCHGAVSAEIGKSPLRRRGRGDDKA